MIGVRRSSTPSPATTAFFLMALGSIVFMMLIYNLPVPNGEDVDDDGISDNFQKVQPVEDIIKDGDDWRIETVGYRSNFDIPFLLFTGIILFLVIPFTVAIWQWDGPRRKERIDRWKEEGKMHDSVRRVAAFLEINPSLPSAVKLTRISLPEKDQYLLGELAWAPFSEGIPFDDAYAEFSSRWSERAPLLGNALAALSPAEKESTRTEVMLSARSVVDRLSEGSKALMESYSRSLAGPSTALFGLGVLLPILLATMIPVAGISGRTALLIGSFLWFILPAGIMMAGSRLVLKRPSLSVQNEMKGSIRIIPGPADLSLILIGSIPLLAVIHILITGQAPQLLLSTGLDRGSILLLSSLLGLSFTLAGLINILAREPELHGSRWDQVRTRSPKILRSISSSIQEGHSFEHALKKTLSENVLLEGRRHFLMPGELLEETGIPEPLSSYLESASEFSKAGKGPGGKAIKAFSRHIKELLDLEKELASRVRGAVGQMEVTSSIFAPLMIGTSAGIFTLMGSVGNEVPEGMLFSSGSGTMMEPAHFLLLASGYLFMLSIVTTLTIFRLEKGSIKGGWHRVPRRLVQSSLAFCAGAIGSSLLLG